MLRSPLRSPFVDLLRPSVGVAGLSIVQQAIGILRSYGADAHIYLPGVGTVNGITAGNYLESTGVTAATVDNPVGLSLDALQAMTLGSELVTNGDFSNGTTGWIVGAGWVISGGSATQTTPGVLGQSIAGLSGKTCQYSFDLTISTGNIIFRPSYFSTDSQQTFTTSGRKSFIAKAIANGIEFLSSVASDGVIDNISVREIPGIHATQGTTANKPILRQSGGKYYWQFDSTDLLTATYPAGYESATIIDAVTSGVVTNQGVNVVGSYSIGPSVNTAGRILMRTAPTAPELAVLQAYARSLI